MFETILQPCRTRPAIFACAHHAALASFITAVAVSSWYVSPARAHDDYEAECCNNKHCAPLASDKLHREGPYWVLADGRKILAGTTRSSRLIGKTGFHLCDWQPGDSIPPTYEKQTLVEPKGRPVCLYVPDGEY